MNLKSIAYLTYALISYLIGLGGLVYFICFTGNFMVPKQLDGLLQMPLWQAIGLNLLAILVFGAQHSIMARKSFKNWAEKYIPKPLERSTYVMMSGAAIMAFVYLWQPLGGTIWAIQNPAGVTAMYVLFLLGWGIVFLTSFLINHFDLFGLRQAWMFAQGKPYSEIPFRTPLFYKFVRHPLYFGVLLGVWATPHMTATHLVFSALITGYILVGIYLEEIDLVAHFGDTYRKYRHRVSMIIPMLPKKEKAATPAPEKIPGEIAAD